MAVFSSLSEFLLHNELPHGRLMCLDVGDKFIGIAISDTLRLISSPYKLYERKSYQKDGLEIATLASKEGVAAVIIGLPVNLSGEIGAQAEKTIQFIKKIENQVHIPLIFWDERFSSQAVEKMMLSFDTSRKKREKLIDKLASTYILQGVLDYLKR